MPEEEHTSQEQAPHHVGTLAKGLERLPEAEADDSLLLLVCLVNGGNLFSDIEIRRSKLADPAEIFHCLLTAVVEEEPTGGFPNPQRTDEQHASRNELNGKWNDPLLMAWGQMLLNTILGKE